MCAVVALLHRLHWHRLESAAHLLDSSLSEMSLYFDGVHDSARVSVICYVPRLNEPQFPYLRGLCWARCLLWRTLLMIKPIVTYSSSLIRWLAVKRFPFIILFSNLSMMLLVGCDGWAGDPAAVRMTHHWGVAEIACGDLQMTTSVSSAFVLFDLISTTSLFITSENMFLMMFLFHIWVLCSVPLQLFSMYA